MKCKRIQCNLIKLLSKITLPFLIFFLPQLILAQYNNLEFENFSRDNGLSISFVTCLIQDKEGFIWFGTFDNGLNRYDGYNLKQYKNTLNDNKTLSNNLIKSIYEEKKGVLWIGTRMGGLNKYDKATEQFISYKHNPRDPNSICNNEINSICKDRKEILWIGTINGLDRFDENNNSFIHYYHNQSDTNSIIGINVLAIYEDRSGNLWIGTNKGLDRFDREKNIFIHYKNIWSDNSNINNRIIHCFYEDKEGTIWIGTSSGLIKLNYLNDSNYFFTAFYFNKNKNENDISSIYKDENEMLWIGTTGTGLYIFNPKTEIFTNYKNNANDIHSLISDRVSINSIIEDRSGVIWIGTKLGISKYSKNKNKFNFYPYNEPVQRWSIFEDIKGNIWVTGKNNFHIRDTNGIFKIVTYKLPDNPHLLSGLIRIGLSDKSGVIWLACNSLLSTYNPRTGTLIYFHDFFDSTGLQNPYIRVIFEDSDSLLWIGTSHGLWVINRERTNLSNFNHDDNDPFSINSNSIMTFIYEDNKGSIWIPLFHYGIDKYDKKARKFYHYQNNPSDSNSLSGDYNSCLYDDNNGNLWITSVCGLDKLNINSNIFTHFTRKDGIADDYTAWILPDNSKNLWIATNSGISKFNPVTNTFRNYDMEDGLHEVEFTDIGLISKKGEMFFAGPKGFNYFFPDSTKENTHIPPVVVTSFKIFNKEAELTNSITTTKEIELSHDENFFSFEFAALDYANPKKNQYKYILEGVDNEWFNSGNIRTANYTNISPGEYVFRVKGSNNDGVWNEEGTSIRIIITPPWWQTWWFRTCGIIILAGSIGFVFNRRIRSIKNEKKQQEDFTRQLISAHEDERKRIARELHDSLSQNLLIIKNKAVLGFTNDDKILFNDISDISSSTLQEVREISYNLHPYQLERLGLTKAIKSITERALKSTNIDFKNDLDIIDKIFNPEEEINIYRIIQECVNNIIRHSGATKAELLIKRETDEVLITISDNGKGFDVNAVLSDKSKRGIGLMDIIERAKIFNGIVDFDSVPGKETKCRIIIPLINKNNKL